MIYTSYFAKTKCLVEAGIYPIGITQFPPRFFEEYPNIQGVAPTKSILFEYKANSDINRYTQRYTEEVLVTLNPQAFVDYLFDLSGGKDVALLCYEKPSDFCHRLLLADFLNQALGINIQEYDFQKAINLS